LTGSQKVGGSNPPGSTNKPKATIPRSGNPGSYLSISPNSYTGLAVPLYRLIEGFLLSCRVENKSPATVSFYKNILDKFQWFLNKFGIDTIDPISIRSFLAYVKDSENRWDSVNARANKKVAPYTLERYYTGLSALFRWSMEEGLIEVNPMATIKKPKVPRKIVKGLEADKIHTLLSSFTCNSFTDYRNKAIFFVFLDTGLRLSELANMTLSDIIIQKGIIRVVGKGNKERLVRIGLKTQKVLWSYLARRNSDSDYVWLNEDGQPILANGIAQMIRIMGRRLDIPMSPHKLRHSFAISFLRNGANPFELQIALGHSTLEMTRRYTQALGFDDVFKRHVLASPVDRAI